MKEGRKEAGREKGREGGRKEGKEKERKEGKKERNRKKRREEGRKKKWFFCPEFRAGSFKAQSLNQQHQCHLGTFRNVIN